MSDRNSEGRSSGNGRQDAEEESQRITWTIHAVPEDNGEAGSGSSSSGEDEDVGRRRSQQEQDRAADRDYALRLAHAMAHNPADALLPSPPRTPPRPLPNPSLVPSSSRQTVQAQPSRSDRRPVTVNDIQNRNCWICSDGDADEQEGASTSRRWIHPCRCTLVAHEDCLILWIRTRRDQDPRKPITCPQCSQPYDIRERKSNTLAMLEIGNRWLKTVVPYAAGGVAGGGVLLAATAYGCAAIRLWIGKSAAERMLGGRWPAHYFLDIPSIPFVLVAWRFRIFDAFTMLLPTFTLTFSMTSMLLQTPLAEALLFPWSALRGFHRPWDRRTVSSSSGKELQRQWPPSPSMTVLLMPLVRAAYIVLKLRVTRKVLKPFSRRPQQDSDPSEAQAAQPVEPGARRRPRVHFIIMAEDVPRQALDDDGVVAVDENGNPREIPPGAEAVEANRTTYVSMHSICRLVLGALGSPIIANVMGKLLARCARYNEWLRRFLGMKKYPSPSLSVGTSATNRTPIANLFATGSLYPDEGSKPAYGEHPSRVTPATYERWEDESLTRFSVLHPDSLLEGLDPVWFRNTLGLGLFVVAKDIVQLSYRYLRLEHARHRKERTKIVDRPFVGGIIDQLELRESRN